MSGRPRPGLPGLGKVVTGNHHNPFEVALPIPHRGAVKSQMCSSFVGPSCPCGDLRGTCGLYVGRAQDSDGFSAQAMKELIKCLLLCPPLSP